MNKYIKGILDTRGWKEVEGMFKEAIRECESSKDIPNNIRNDVYVREVRARIIAAEKMGKLLLNIKLSKGGSPQDKISYK